MKSRGGGSTTAAGESTPSSEPDPAAVVISPLAPIALPARNRWYSTRNEASLLRSMTFGIKSSGGGNWSSVKDGGGRPWLLELPGMPVPGAPSLTDWGESAEAALLWCSRSSRPRSVGMGWPHAAMIGGCAAASRLCAAGGAKPPDASPPAIATGSSTASSLSLKIPSSSSSPSPMRRTSARSRAMTVESSPLAPTASPARNFW
mmetsp:Transcript_50655/g.142367  ORF Transcript_50655/g.142367 Transcript_50655/m.142367 type:complete len:204 (+) Transcript_50655:129-740(+)